MLFLFLHSYFQFFAQPDRVIGETFANIPMEKLLSKAYASERRKQIGEYANRNIKAGASILEDGVYYGASESRKDGHAEGY